MKCAAYIRVSTEQQTADNQLPAIEALCQARSWQLVHVYSENESAWKSGHQAELAHLLEDARKGQFQIVVCWALDRLSRQGALAILQLVDRFKRYGVRVISYQESWTETPPEFAEVLYAMIGWVAQMESKRQSERVKAGLARANAESKGKRGPDQVRRKRRWFKRPGLD